MLITLAFVLPDLKELINYDEPVPKVIKYAVGSPGAPIGFIIPICVLVLLCGISCTTGAYRCTWAFSRDGAVPGYKIWQKISKTLRVPFNAMMLNMVVPTFRLRSARFILAQRPRSTLFLPLGQYFSL